MNYKNVPDEQFLDKIDEMFPLLDESGKREDMGKQGQNDLKAVTLSILDSIPHAVIGLKDRRIIFANHAVKLVFGWKIEELIGKSTRVLYRSDEEYEEIAGYTYPALEKQRTYSREFHCRHKDGRDIVCLVSSSRVGEILKDRMIVVTYSDVTGQRQAEESLRLANIYNRTLLEACLDPLVAIDPAGKISYVNAAAEKITGYSRGELIGTDVSSYFTEPEKVKAEYRKVLREGALYNYPLEVRHRDGRVTPVLYNASVYRDKSDNVIGVLAAARDITEHKRVEEALREHDAQFETLLKERTIELTKTTSLLEREVIERKYTEEQLREAHARLLMVLDSLNSSVYIIDMDTYEVLYINKHMMDLFGDVTGKICWQSILNQPGPCDFCVDEKLLTPERKKSGFYIWEQYHEALGIWLLIQDQTMAIQWIDGRTGRLKIATDISKHKLVEEAVHKTQLQQKAILDNIPDMAWLKDRESRYIAVNEAFGKACGLKPADVVGLIDSDIWPAELAEKYKEDDKKVIECGTRKQVEEPLVGKDGRESWIEVIRTPIYDDGGEIIGTAGIARDITERKRAEEDLKKRKWELEAKSLNLQEVNIALKVLLKQREEDKTDLEEKVLSNVKEFVEPYVEKLKKTRLTVHQIACVSIVETHLNDIISPFLRNLTSKYLHLTPREIQIANLIKEGKTSKEIAELLNSSQGAINFHRNNIRNKLGLNKKTTNLRSHLLSLS